MNRNGAWPHLPSVPPPLPELGEHPTQDELTQALGSTLVVFAHLWPRCVQALEYLRDGLERHELAHEAHELPAQRARAMSSNEIAHVVARDVVSQYGEDVGSDPSIPPPDLYGRVSDRVRIEMLRLKAREKEAARRARRRLIAALSAFAIAAATAGLQALVHALK